MAYKAPGVYVTDKYIEPASTRMENARFIPAVIGTPKKVIENWWAKRADGTPQMYTHTTGGTFTIDVSPVVDFYDDIEDAKVFLIPNAGSKEVLFNSYTKQRMVNYGIPVPSNPEGAIEIPSNKITINSSLRQLTIDTSGVSGLSSGDYHIVVELISKPQKIKSLTWSIPKNGTTNDYDYTSNNGMLVIKLRDLPPEAVLVQPSSSYSYILKYTPQGNNQVTRTVVVNEINFETKTITVEVAKINDAYPIDITEVILTFYVENPGYASPVMCDTVSKIEQAFGAIHPLNELAYAAYHAQQNAGMVLVVPLNSPTDIQTALDFIDSNDSVYAIAPLFNAKSETWLNVLDNWLSKYENDPTGAVPRIAFVGFSSFNDYGTYTNSSQAADNLVAFVARYEQKRLRVLANTNFIHRYYPKTVAGTVADQYYSIPMPGYMFGGVYVGTVCRKMNDLMPDYSFTLKTVPIVDDLIYPNGYNRGEWFSKQDMNKMAAAGMWVFSKRPGASEIMCRHAVTTAESQRSTMDDAIVRVVDFVMLDIRAALNRLIGNIRLDNYSINNTIMPMLNEKFREYISRNIISDKSKVKTISINPETKDTLDIVVTLEVAGIANTIQIVFEVA